MTRMQVRTFTLVGLRVGLLGSSISTSKLSKNCKDEKGRGERRREHRARCSFTHLFEALFQEAAGDIALGDSRSCTKSRHLDRVQDVRRNLCGRKRRTAA